MRLLVIGGGRFFGAALVDAALAAGQEVAAVQRGLTSRQAPTGSKCWQATGPTDLPALLAGREFEAALDTCGFLPDVVERFTDLLRDAVGRYCFISSVSAYANEGAREFVEDVSPLDERQPTHEEFNLEDYGPRKVRCEHVVGAAFGPRAVLVRPRSA